MAVVKAANLAVRFLLELGALTALAFWGFRTGEGALRWIIGLGAPLVAAVVWGMFVAPKAFVSAPGGVRFAVEVAVWASATVALAAAGLPGLAVAFALVVTVNRILVTLWGR